MKIDAGVFALFASPLIAVLAGIIMLLFLSGHTPYVPDRPEFLSYIDRLGFSPEGGARSNTAGVIRNVFSPHSPDEEDDSLGPENPAPVFVSMIVKNDGKSFCIIDGRKMQVGDETGAFTLKAIEKGAVTIRYKNGVEETIHVEVY